MISAGAASVLEASRLGIKSGRERSEDPTLSYHKNSLRLIRRAFAFSRQSLPLVRSSGQKPGFLFVAQSLGCEREVWLSSNSLTALH